MDMNNDLRRLILQRVPSMDLEATAIKSGMVTLEQSGVIKALQGLTSLEEVYRVSRVGE